VPYDSDQKVQEVLRHFLQYDKDKQEVKGIGDQAYAWGWQGTHLVVRKDKYALYFSAGYCVDCYPDLQVLEHLEKQRRQVQEIRRINEEFANTS